MAKKGGNYGNLLAKCYSSISLKWTEEKMKGEGV